MARSWELPSKEFQDAVFLVDFKGYGIPCILPCYLCTREKNNSQNLKIVRLITPLLNTIFPLHLILNEIFRKLVYEKIVITTKFENRIHSDILPILINPIVIGTNYCIVRNTLRNTFVFISTNPFSPYSRHIYMYIQFLNGH